MLESELALHWRGAHIGSQSSFCLPVLLCLRVRFGFCWFALGRVKPSFFYENVLCSRQWPRFGLDSESPIRCTKPMHRANLLPMHQSSSQKQPVPSTKCVVWPLRSEAFYRLVRRATQISLSSLFHKAAEFYLRHLFNLQPATKSCDCVQSLGL